MPVPNKRDDASRTWQDECASFSNADLIRLLRQRARVRVLVHNTRRTEVLPSNRDAAILLEVCKRLETAIVFPKGYKPPRPRGLGGA